MLRSVANKENLRLDVYCKEVCVCQKETSVASRCQFIPGSEKPRKNIETSSLSPQNGLYLTVVGRIIAFLAMFLEEMRLMWLSCPVPNVLEGQGLKDTKFPQVYQESASSHCNFFLSQGIYSFISFVSSCLLDTWESIWIVVKDSNQCFIWSLHEMQISVLMEVLALKCFCNHLCVCMCTLPRLILFFIFINCEAFCRPGHCCSVYNLV